MRLVRLESIARQNSNKTFDELVLKYKEDINKKQDELDDTAKNIVCYFEFFDSRSRRLIKIFSDKATKELEIENEFYLDNGEPINGVVAIFGTKNLKYVQELKF